jgi:hypothetical protein
VWLKGGNHSLKDAFSKAFVKRSVSLQPSKEQGAIQRVDQQLWIRRRLQFAGRNSVFDDSALDLTSWLDISLQATESSGFITFGANTIHYIELADEDSFYACGPLES